MRWLLLSVLLATTASCRTYRAEMRVTCYSGGHEIYRGELTRVGSSWVDADGEIVVLDADCVGFANWVATSSRSASKGDCRGLCSHLPKHRRASCVRRCERDR